MTMQQSCQYQHHDPPSWCCELLVLVFTILLGCHMFWHLGAATAERQFRLKLMLRLLQAAETRLVLMRDQVSSWQKLLGSRHLPRSCATGLAENLQACMSG